LVEGKMKTSICIVLCLIGITLALPSATFDQEPTIKVLQNSKVSTIEEAFYVVESLKSFGAMPKDKTNLCSMATDTLSDASDIKSIFYAVCVSDDLGCAKRASERVAGVVLNTPNFETTEDLYYGTLAAYRLKAKQRLSFDDKKFYNVIDSLSDLSAVDGTVKNSISDARGTIYHAGLAYEALATIANSGDKDLPSEQRLVVSIFRENIESLLELHTETDDGVMFYDDNSASPLPVTSSFIVGALSLSEDEYDAFFEDNVLDHVTSHILVNAPRGNLRDIYYFSRLLAAVTGENLPDTIVLSLQKTTLSSNIKADGNIVVSVTNLVGKPIADVNVFLMKASSFVDDSVLYSNQQLTQTSDTEFELNFFAAKPQQGFYYLEFGVQTEDSLRTTFRTLKIVTSVSVSPVQINILDSADKEILETFRVSPSGNPHNFKVTYFNTLDISFSVKNVATNKPTTIQQAFVRFAGENSEATFVGQVTGESYRLVLELKNVGKELLFLSGDYEVSLITGDAFIDNSSLFVLGNMNINFPPSLQAPTHASVYDFKPEIDHKFRVPEKRPSESVSFAFTLGVFSPVAILLIGLLGTGTSFQFPSGLGFIFSLLFLGTFYAIFALYAGFWFGEYNMFQTLQMLGVLSVFAFFFGNQALRAKGAVRLAQKEKVE